MARHVYTNDDEWFIAESLEQAKSFAMEYYGGLADDLDVERIRELADDSPLTINYPDADEGEPAKETHTCAEWAARFHTVAHADESVLCSTEW